MRRGAPRHRARQTERSGARPGRFHDAGRGRRLARALPARAGRSPRRGAGGAHHGLERGPRDRRIARHPLSREALRHEPAAGVGTRPGAGAGLVKRAFGLEAIIDYKLTKAVVELILGVLLVVGLVRGPEAMSATFAQAILDHASGAWALRVATLIVLTGTSGHVQIATAVAIGDSALSALEGLALRAGK